ncbi:hypothetical protein P43SY_001369 [Pythium insidiosum]|uniref:Cytochrome b-c1 complex subunit 9 n=1 Tax=Pythium insidiosum TaxID=114742 RepID=A0AAD5LPI6_PYTIN|nr:hypothetical protein P43SY_001369 [Pythium insidiosum]KAJ0408086.1 hypothetical protein ATCC90586_006057 [Pythium insidiosum]
MLGRSLRQTTARMAQGARMASTKHSSLNGAGAYEGVYQAVMKTNVTYVATIIAAAVAVEVVYGKATSFVWESVNRGRLYHHIDWTQFKTDDDDEDEE